MGPRAGLDIVEKIIILPWPSSLYPINIRTPTKFKLGFLRNSSKQLTQQMILFQKIILHLVMTVHLSLNCFQGDHLWKRRGREKHWHPPTRQVVTSQNTILWDNNKWHSQIPQETTYWDRVRQAGLYLVADVKLPFPTWFLNFQCHSPLCLHISSLEHFCIASFSQNVLNFKLFFSCTESNMFESSSQLFTRYILLSFISYITYSI